MKALEANPDPALALNNLERWVHATGNPRLYLEQFTAKAQAAWELLYLFGASQPIADSILQNPELGTMVLDQREGGTLPTEEEMVAEGRRLLLSAISPTHALDRLRFVKQRYNLPIVLADLAQDVDQPIVWRALSDLADALIQLTFESVWKGFRASQAGKDLPEEPPLSVIGFGKLGGRELNYSSDVDLAYVAQDGLSESLERAATRFCQLFGRALSDRMGRGSLFRVDLRLRPYGNAGPILNSIGSCESYYRLYADPWEVQALLKSRVICGVPAKERWGNLVSERCFPAKISEGAIEEMADTRRRIEGISKGDDIKRGPGGIRDVEFLCQMLQLLHGHDHPTVRHSATLEALAALAEENLLDQGSANALLAGYTFLRKLENRAQVVGDRQTHSIPADASAREKLALLMSLPDWRSLERDLDFHRRTIHSLYRSFFRHEPRDRAEREAVGELVGAEATSLWHWFDIWPEPDVFYRSLLENRDSLRRVSEVLDYAPALVTPFKSSLQMTEMLISGEIEEHFDPGSKLERLPLTADLATVGEAYWSGKTALATQYLLERSVGSVEDPCVPLGQLLTELTDSLIRHVAERTGLNCDVVALGSYGLANLGLNSDSDLLLLVQSGHAEAEREAQAFLGAMTQLKRFGVDLEVDLRLRPEGKKGMLVRTYDGFGAYEVQGMEMWERFALGQARLVRGREEAMELVRHAAYALPLTKERFRELVEMKSRIENERVKPQHLSRDVKLGHGGLSDIEWTVQLMELRHSALEMLEGYKKMPDRIQGLGRLGFLNALEVDSLIRARAHLLNVRTWLALQQIKGDLVPENPAKLERLARAMGQATPNDFLRHHEPIVSWVRALFMETLDRLAK